MRPRTGKSPIRKETEVERCAALKAALPDALRLLMARHGLESLRAASRYIGERTGSSLTPMTLSLWTRGEGVPSFDSLVDFLVALGLDLRDLASALDEVVSRTQVETDQLALTIAERLRADPTLESEMRALLERTSSQSTDAAADGGLLSLVRIGAAGSAESNDQRSGS